MDDESLDFDLKENKLLQSQSYLELDSTIKKIYKFMQNFSFLQFGRDTVITSSTWIFSIVTILDSASKTLLSLLNCIKHVRFADSHMLIRKYRDDLFFYLYVVAVDGSRTFFDNATTSKHEENINKWKNSSLSNLLLKDILVYLSSRPQLEDAVKHFKLKNKFDHINKRLNNYIHGNGLMYYNYNCTIYSDETLSSILLTMKEYIVFITTTFAFLLALCKPLSIMSVDYMDYLDCNDIPPEDSQYWVAEFIVSFFEENGSVLGADCIGYLREKTSMQI